MGQFQDDGRLPGPLSEAVPAAAAAIRAIVVSEVVATSDAGLAATAPVAALQKLAELGIQVFEEYRGTVSQSNESTTADFGDPSAAVRAASEIQRRLLLLQTKDPESQGALLRVAVASGPVERRANGHIGGLGVELTVRITRRAAPGQVLISRGVRDAIALETDIRCAWSGTVEGLSSGQREEFFEVLWNGDQRTPKRSVETPVERGPVPETSAIATPGPAASETADLASAGFAPPAGSGEVLVERYEILGQLGSGGMGVVYKARDRETAEIVALKSLRPEVAADAATMERFKNELRLARKITHKNVCRIHDFVRSGGTAYISMEFVEGETLRNVLTRFGSMSVRKGVQIARQICSGLVEAHAQGIVHRDLKPENVMIDRHGNVKLMDFGVARSMQSGNTTGAGIAIGTPAYMSPEQAEGRPADGRSDVYSLGLILYEMFTGVAAFRGDTPLSLALKQIRERPPTPREHDAAIPEYLEQTILRCIEKSPAQRFQTIKEVDDALGRQTLTPWSTSGAGEAGETVAGWVRVREKALLVLALVGLGLIGALVERVYPPAGLRLQIDFAHARSDARRYLRLLLPAAQPSQMARVWIDGRAGDDMQPTDPRRGQQVFEWMFRWRAATSPDGEVRGYVHVDDTGRLRSFRRLDPLGGDHRLPEDTSALRARAADLSRSLLGFDTGPASLKSETRYDPDGSPYLHYDWTAHQRDEVGYRTATVDLSPAGVRALSTAYAHYVTLPLPVQYWNDMLGGFLFALLMLGVFLTRTVNVGATRLRRPLVLSAAIGAWAATALPLIEGWLPQGDWPAHVLLGLAYFALIYFVSAAGEDTLLSLWPAKVATWTRPLEGRRLGAPAAVSVLRGTLFGLAFIAVYIGLTTLLPSDFARLRTWVLEWPQDSAWDPAASFLIGDVALCLVLATGPIAVSMAFLRRWLRSPWALAPTVALVTTFVYRQEVLYPEVFGAYVALSFVGFLWFAWCFLETDLLGTVVAMAMFNGVVGTVALMKMNQDVAPVSFVLALAALAAVPIFAIVSLRLAAHDGGAAGPAGAAPSPA